MRRMSSCLSRSAGIRRSSRHDHATLTALMETAQNNSSDALAKPGACTIEKPSFMLCLVAYFDRASCSGAWGVGWSF